MQQAQLKTKKPDFEFYDAGDERYCKLKVGNINIDAPVDDVQKILVGMGFFALALLLLYAISND